MTNEAGNTTDVTTTPEPQIGRNEDCPCGSGKKYKRCHGVGAAPKYTTPAAQPQMTAGAPGMPPGFDPSQMDPAMMSQMTQMLQRLPRAQMMKLQSIMQRAMAGQDVAAEAAMIEKMLPPEFAEMSRQMMMASGMMSQMNTPAELPKTEDDAKKIIVEALSAGKLTEAQAKELLGADADKIIEDSKKKGIGRFFGLGKK
jgi:hypothetical protein